MPITQSTLDAYQRQRSDAESSGGVRAPSDDINSLYRSTGPWSCTVCGGYSWRPYRCDAPRGDGICGADLVTQGDTSTTRHARI